MINSHASRKYFRYLASDSGLSWSEHTKGDGSFYTDGSTIFTPPMPVFTDPHGVDYARWWHGAMHECWHNQPQHRGDFTYIRHNKINMQSLYGMLLNVVVDSNIEMDNWGRYEGRDVLTRRSWDAVIREQNSSNELVPDTHDANVFHAVFLYNLGQRSAWMGTLDANESKYPPRVVDYLSTLVKDDTLSDMWTVVRESGQENASVVDYMLDLLGVDASEELEKAQQEQECEGLRRVALWSPLKDAHSEGGASISGLHTHYNDDKYTPCGEFIQMPCEEIKLQAGTIDPSVAELVTDNLPSQLRRELQSMSQARYQGGKTRGRINGKRLSSVATGNDRVMKRKRVSIQLDTAVLLLVDASGSMGGEKHAVARGAAVSLSNTLTPLGIPNSVASFKSTSDRNILEVYKTFTERTSPDELLSRASQSYCCHSNSDGECLLWGVNKISAQANKRKLIIVLSDGSPNARREGNEYLFTKNVIQGIEQSSSIEIVGIGIQDSNVVDLYSRSVVITDTAQLEEALLTVLRQEVLDGHNRD